MAGPTRKDTFRVSVFVEGINWPGQDRIWDKKTGGGVDSEDTKYYPGGMVPPVSLGGRRTVENLVVSRLYRHERDHLIVDDLLKKVGKANMSVQQLPMDINGSAFDGDPIIWRGILKRVTVPEVDSESNDAALLELEMSVEGYPTV
jgi:hypothetical protein